MYVLIVDNLMGDLVVGLESDDGIGCGFLYEGPAGPRHEMKAYRVAQNEGEFRGLPVYVQCDNRPKILIQDFPLRVGKYITEPTDFCWYFP